ASRRALHRVLHLQHRVAELGNGLQSTLPAGIADDESLAPAFVLVLECPAELERQGEDVAGAVQQTGRRRRVRRRCAFGCRAGGGGTGERRLPPASAPAACPPVGGRPGAGIIPPPPEVLYSSSPVAEPRSSARRTGR